MRTRRLRVGTTEIQNNLRGRLIRRLLARYEYEPADATRGWFYSRLTFHLSIELTLLSVVPRVRPYYRPAPRLPVRRELSGPTGLCRSTVEMRRVCFEAGATSLYEPMLGSLWYQLGLIRVEKLAILEVDVRHDNGRLRPWIYRGLFPRRARWLALSFRDGVPIDFYPRLPLLPRGSARAIYRLSTILTDNLERSCGRLSTIRIRP